MVGIALSLLLAVQPAAQERQVGVPIGKGTVAPRVTLEAPAGGWTVGRMLQITGQVSDKTVDPVRVSINGDRHPYAKA